MRERKAMRSRELNGTVPILSLTLMIRFILICLHSPRSLHAYCETDHSDDETDTKQDRSNKDVVENANLKKAEPDRPIEQKKLSKRTPLLESRRAAIIIAEQAIAAYAEEATVTNARAENMMPVVSCPKDFQDGAAIDKSLDSHCGSRDLCDSSLETRRQKLNSSMKQ